MNKITIKTVVLKRKVLLTLLILFFSSPALGMWKSTAIDCRGLGKLAEKVAAAILGEFYIPYTHIEISKNLKTILFSGIRK